MNRSEIESTVRYVPAVQPALAQDVTFVMPFYKRMKYFSHYLKEGFWDGFRLQIICDGSPDEIVESLKKTLHTKSSVDIHAYPSNKGVAYARTAGIERVSTPFLSFCDDDDIIIDGHQFVNHAITAMQKDESILFYAMQDVYAFTEELHMGLQYDRRIFDKRTGKDLLTYMVFNGEISLLSLGSVFRSKDLRGIGPDTFFKVSEDYVYLARLCARYPQKRIAVNKSRGSYLRLTQHDSLSARKSYSIEKIVMNFISMFVGAHHLINMGGINKEAFQRILIKRGTVLKSSYGKGEETGMLLSKLLESGNMDSLSATSLSEEQQLVMHFLRQHEKNLPPEFYALTYGEVSA